MAAPISSTGRAPKRSTSMPAGISATAEPRPTAANTAPNPAGPRPNLFWISMPMAGRPNCTTDTAAWAMTAMISVVRGRGLIATRYPGLAECMLGPVSAIERTAPEMNYEIHGNSIPHLHLHLYPRFSGDPFEGRPVAMDTPAFTRTEDDLRRMADAIVAVRRGASQTA